jgi:hypothetical protein
MSFSKRGITFRGMPTITMNLFCCMIALATAFGNCFFHGVRHVEMLVIKNLL